MFIRKDTILEYGELKCIEELLYIVTFLTSDSKSASKEYINFERLFLQDVCLIGVNSRFDFTSWREFLERNRKLCRVWKFVIFLTATFKSFRIFRYERE